MNRSFRLFPPYDGLGLASFTRGKVYLQNAARSSGLHIQATRGSGKSTLEAIIALADFARDKPVVLFEVQGGLVEQLLWRLGHLDKSTKRRLIPKIIYADMSGRADRIIGWPLLYRLPGDSLYDVSQRYIELIKRMDPDLSNAPILGANALDYLGTYTGMALFAMGCQLTEAIDLLSNPEVWAARLRQAAEADPEAEPAVRFFLNEYPRIPEHERRSLALTLRTKLARFTLNPNLKAMFGASTPGIDWDEVVRDSKLVILDFQDIRNDDDLRFKMRWCFSHVWEYIKQRENGRDKPISIILDELSYLLSMKAGSDDLLAADLDNFINKDMRYRNVWLTAAHQELYQIPSDRIRKTLLSMGTQILGATSDPEAVRTIAETYFEYDPDWVKKVVSHKAVIQEQLSENDRKFRRSGLPEYQLIETSRTTEEYALEEQRQMFVQQFLEVNKFEFLVAHSGSEGALSRELTRVNISRLVRLIGFPHQEAVARARQQLIEASGLQTQAVLEQISQRLSALPAARSRQITRSVELDT